ncbi:MAG: 2-C-methyl-D-erythritol 2,4-cyclodiphosphate synthase [Candidatus Omnitrophica bacterium CG1_02_49_10]|nr:MAG: 2-C-methyl-D-erythritol 2,4-cyclodiphosphate synthase [Candidatus Omnitrophica bacterium CG1_02_49_10]
MRVGIGYDIHRFEDGRPLFLGGVEIPSKKGLAGHSDADVMIHAVCDALLGAIGAGDIGEHFPDDDAAYKDISSLKLLSRVSAIVLEKGFSVENVDVVLVAEEPHISPFKSKMRENISKHLGIDPDKVNIKATTNEGIGSLGRAEGISANAVAMVKEME